MSTPGVFYRDQRGTDTIEYVALMALVAVILFPVLRPIFDGLQTKLQAFMEAL